MTPGQAYEAFLVPALFLPWAEAVLKLNPPRVGTYVLDVACGTGIGGRLAARIVGPGGRVVGLDSDDGMLAVARGSARSSEDAPIEWHQGDAQGMPFGAATFDYVICLEGIQFFPSRLAGLREIRRVLRPGGQVVASVWGPLHANELRTAMAAAGFGRVAVSAEALISPCHRRKRSWNGSLRAGRPCAATSRSCRRAGGRTSVDWSPSCLSVIARRAASPCRVVAMSWWRVSGVPPPVPAARYGHLAPDHPLQK